MENKTLLSIKEVSTLLGTKESWVRSAIFKNEIPYLKIGRLIRFDESSIQKWLLAKKVGLK